MKIELMEEHWKIAFISVHGLECVFFRWMLITQMWNILPQFQYLSNIELFSNLFICSVLGFFCSSRYSDAHMSSFSKLKSNNNLQWSYINFIRLSGSFFLSYNSLRWHFISFAHSRSALNERRLNVFTKIYSQNSW